MGSYTMVVLGYGFYEGDEFTLTSPTQAAFTADVRETFAATQAVNITSTAAVELSATLDRIVTRVKVISTDGKVVNNVPFQRNRNTKLTGSLYTAGTNGSFTINTS